MIRPCPICGCRAKAEQLALSPSVGERSLTGSGWCGPCARFATEERVVLVTAQLDLTARA